jgi:hypothetical protein
MVDNIRVKKSLSINQQEIDKLSRNTGFSRVFSPMGDAFHGIDHRSAGSSFQKNTDHQGLVLFTRPQLNLSYNNVLADRQLLSLLDKDPRSIYRAMRVMLDPRTTKDGSGSDLFDSKQAFMTILTNSLVSISGFPDITVNTYTSTEGIRKEAYSIIDDVAEINNVYDITATFSNIKGDPITSLFHAWIRYAGNVYSGDMVPYPEKIVENEVDYQTRIWRLILDATKKYVVKIGCANVAFPMASPLGSAFNYSSDLPYSTTNDQISIPFRCMGAEYQDPILYNEFNLTVQIHNPDMVDGRRESFYHKLAQSEMDAFNFNGYPRIEPTTLELEWWISIDEYNELTTGVF